MPHIPANILQKLIPMLPNLRRLVLLHTIPDTDFLSLLSESPELFYRIESLIHLAFLRPPGEAEFPAVFSHVSPSNYYFEQDDVVFLPYFTSGQLVQALTDCFSCLRVGTYDSRTFTHCGIPLMATYASAVREPGRSWSERIVPFIPGISCKQREGWIFALRSEGRESILYAFTKINKGLLNERMNELGSLPTQSQTHAEENDIESEYADRQFDCHFDIFDVKSFFQELVKEGRPAPSPEALSKLLELVATLEKAYEYGEVRIMTQDDLRSFLRKTENVAPWDP